METQATPRPWAIAQPAELRNVSQIVDGRGNALASLYYLLNDEPRALAKTEAENGANAAMIVRAVNNHDALVEALEQVLAWSVRANAGPIPWDEVETNIRAALDAAKEATCP